MPTAKLTEPMKRLLLHLLVFIHAWPYGQDIGTAKALVNRNLARWGSRCQGENPDRVYLSIDGRALAEKLEEESHAASR